MSYSESSAAISGQESLDIRAYVRPIWRGKWIILVVVVLAAAGTYAIAARQRKEYVATTAVYVTVPDPAAVVGTSIVPTPPTAQQMLDVATLFTAQPITNSVYHRLGMRIGTAGSVNVVPASSVTTTSFLDVTATSPTPALAARLANTYVTVFLASQRAAAAAAANADVAAAQASLNALPNIPVNTAERQTLLLEISQYRTIARNPDAGAQQIGRALPPTGPSSPRPIRDAVFGAIIGLLLGLAIAYARELLDRRISSVAQLESSYAHPVLAVLPHLRDPLPLTGGRAASPPRVVEAMRSLRVNLRLTSGAEPPRTVLVTSAWPNEGKSTVARNLALAYASAGERTLLLDADLRRSRVPHFLGLEAEFGLTHVLQEAVAFKRAPVPIHTVDGGGVTRSTGNGYAGRTAATDARSDVLDVLVHGEPVDNPVVLLSSNAMKALLATARTHYDVVVIDTAPVLAVTDTVPLLGMVDAVVLVARLGLTTRDDAARLLSTIGRVPEVHVAGVVANDVRDALLGYGGYGRQYAGYGGRYAPDARPRRATRKIGG